MTPSAGQHVAARVALHRSARPKRGREALIWAGVVAMHAVVGWRLLSMKPPPVPAVAHEARPPPVWARLVTPPASARPKSAVAAPAPRRLSPPVPVAVALAVTAHPNPNPMTERPAPVPAPLPAADTGQPSPSDETDTAASTVSASSHRTAPDATTASFGDAAPAPDPPPGASAEVSYLSTVPPVYPRAARQAGREGRVLLRVKVDEAGRCAEVHVASSSGHADLDTAAADAVRQWRFIPARLNGLAVEAYVLVPVRFALRP